MPWAPFCVGACEVVVGRVRRGGKGCKGETSVGAGQGARARPLPTANSAGACAAGQEVSSSLSGRQERAGTANTGLWGRSEATGAAWGVGAVQRGCCPRPRRRGRRRRRAAGRCSARLLALCGLLARVRHATSAVNWYVERVKASPPLPASSEAGMRRGNERAPRRRRRRRPTSRAPVRHLGAPGPQLDILGASNGALVKPRSSQSAPRWPAARLARLAPAAQKHTGRRAATASQAAQGRQAPTGRRGLD